jgi:S-DNA-T family DNA segregation ATPase FtsK/SpoIIIE
MLRVSAGRVAARGVEITIWPADLPAKATMAARKPARKPARRKPRRKSARSPLRSTRHGFPAMPKLSELDQSRRDALGLGLAGAGALLAFVFYFGWDGGRVGHVLSEVLRFFFGAVAYLTPLALFGAAAALILQRGDGEEERHRGLGVVLLGSALMLGFAAGTLGLGPPLHGTRQFFDPDVFMDRGGLFGEALYWAISSLFSRAGAHLVFVFAFAAGLLLTTGTSAAGLIHRGRELISHGASGLRGRLAHERSWAREDAERPVYYDEPEGEPAVRALHEQDAAEPQASFAAEEDALEADEPDPLSRVERDVVKIEGKATESEDAAGESEQPTAEIELTPMGNRRSAVTESDELDYRVPEATLLKRSNGTQSPDASNQEQIAKLLVETLGHFGIEADVVGRVTGPRVTRHELRLAPGTKVSKVTQLKDDLAYALASTDIRILAPIPGKQAVGVEVPNKRHRMVYLGDIFRSDLGEGRKAGAGSSALSVWLGKDIAGNAVWTDLARMPHVLVAGTTGSGKSGCVNTMLSSILLRASPNEVRMVLVDPKRVELNHYEDIPHLLTPVVTAPRMAANVLNNLIREMESRYEVMQGARARNIIELNKSRVAAKERPLPYILCVIDELADLMMVAPAEVEDSIIRLAQKSRAVGIHLVLATQRPSVDIITGTIKVNVPARIAFAVSSQHDSRVILDQGGAETLLGQGDMLFRPVGSSKLQRIQGAYITEEEIARVTDRWRAQGEPAYDPELLEGREIAEDSEGDLSPDEDDLLEEAIHLVAQTQTASVSMIQRRLRVGYTRAGRLIDMLERRGVISGYEGSKPRQVLITEADVTRVLAAGGGEQLPGGAEAPSGFA